MAETATASSCAGCLEPILDRYVLAVLDRQWHAACLRCSDCGEPLTDSCYTRDALILCRLHFARRFGIRCSGCDGSLEKADLVRRAGEKVFHVSCFQCSVCKRTLDTGEQLFILEGNRFVCEADFVLSQSMTSSSSSTSSSSAVSADLLSMACSSSAVSAPLPPTRPISSEPEGASELDEELADGGSDAGGMLLDEDGEGGKSSGCQPGEDPNAAKRRGPRTTIKAKQLETLKSAFASTPKPTRHIREQLAAETGLNMRVIQVWFQNRRSKERRMKQLRYPGFRPSRRCRVGRDDAMPLPEAFAPDASTGYFGPPPLAFYCDVYGTPADRSGLSSFSSLPPPPPASSLPETGSNDPSPSLVLSGPPGGDSVLFERSPLSQPAPLLAVSSAEMEENVFRCISAVYPPPAPHEMKHPLPGCW